MNQGDDSNLAEAVNSRWRLLAEELRRRLGMGSPLDSPIRAVYEARLGTSMSSAMVHRAPLAAQLAATLGAEAFTIGQHVLGDERALDSADPHGAALLGHELVHVAQHSGTMPPLGAGFAVQRAPSEEGEADESQAVSIEREIHRGPPRPRGPAPIDPDELTDRVYRRLLDEVVRERERAALWIWRPGPEVR